MAFKIVFTLAFMTCCAYGYVLRNECNPPTDDPSSTLSTESPTTTERLQTLTPTTETPDQFLPCSGYLTFVLDTGKSLSVQQFENQRNFVANKLFTTENNFNHYERLSVSQYGVFGAQIQEFGFFVNQNDIKEYVNDVVQSTRTANLRRALLSISVAQLHEEITEPLTVAVLVSTLSQQEVDDCRRLAIEIQAQKIRLVLIAHGNNIDTSLLTQVTGNKDLVFEWSADAKEPTDTQKWLRQLLDCPSQLIQIE